MTDSNGREDDSRAPIWNGVALLMGAIGVFTYAACTMTAAVAFSLDGGWSELTSRNRIGVVLVLTAGAVALGCLVGVFAWLIRRRRTSTAIRLITGLLILAGFLTFAAMAAFR